MCRFSMTRGKELDFGWIVKWLHATVCSFCQKKSAKEKAGGVVVLTHPWKKGGLFVLTICRPVNSRLMPLPPPKTVGLHVAMSSVKSAPISHFPWELLIEWPSTRPCNPPRHPLEDPIPRTTIELHLAGLVA